MNKKQVVFVLVIIVLSTLVVAQEEKVTDCSGIFGYIGCFFDKFTGREDALVGKADVPSEDSVSQIVEGTESNVDDTETTIQEFISAEEVPPDSSSEAERALEIAMDLPSPVVEASAPAAVTALTSPAG